MISSHPVQSQTNRTQRSTTSAKKSYITAKGLGEESDSKESASGDVGDNRIGDDSKFGDDSSNLDIQSIQADNSIVTYCERLFDGM